MNILIKLMSIVSLVVAPTLAQIHQSDAHASEIKKEKTVEVSIISHDSSAAKVEVVEGPNEGLIGALNADGLIKKGDNDIEYKNNTLTVNGVVLDAEKYKSYIKGSEMSIKIKQTETNK